MSFDQKPYNGKKEKTETKFNERDENDLVFGTFTVTGYFFINIILLIGILAKDDSNMTVSFSHIPIEIEKPDKLLDAPVQHIWFYFPFIAWF